MPAYYNENEPFAAQWLRNLIAAGHIAPGDVDERSIEDVSPSDLKSYEQCHFFAGVGVWSYALRQAGWPDSKPIWTGSCPCQPFSAAGQGAGFADERHLWPAWYHLIDERRPAIVLGEQVASKNADPWIDLVQADMEAVGHAFGCVPFPSAGVGAPHIRDRNYWVAYADSTRSLSSAFTRVHRGEEGAGPRHGELERHGSTGRLEHAVSDRSQRRLRGRQDSQRKGFDESLGRDGTACRLADANGGNTGTERQQRGGQHGQQPQDGGVVIGLADAEHNGRDRSQGASSLTNSDGQVVGLSDRNSAAGRLEHASSERRQRRETTPSRHNNDRKTPERSEGQHGAGESGPLGFHTHTTGPTNGFWRNADWLLCKDGRWRPVRPGSFPLAHGAPARMGRLRAYGNAINAQAAKTFIEVVMDYLGYGDL